MGCARCGREDVKIWPDDGLCSFCGITEKGGFAVTGIEPAMRGRVDRINPYKDTIRAIQFMANNPSERATPAELARWARQARATLPDRSFKMPEGHDPATPSRPALDRVDREHLGRIQDLWNKAKYEVDVLRKKPTTEIQRANYEAVKRWGGET